ncbi:MAG: SEL1-like repeat protein [Oscillospiraceae bacterium]|nr:SEL1-like repeat protein [Oscillospiraceae bacterium]
MYFIKSQLSRFLSVFLCCILFFFIFNPAVAFCSDSDNLYNEGLRYFNGDGVTQDIPEAISLIKQAAEEGSDKAKVQLAFFYMYGLGSQITDDYEDNTGHIYALNLLDDVAKDGDVVLASEAMLQAAYAYFLGNDPLVPIDDQTAFLFFQAAAELGNTEALNTMGIFYTYGFVVEKDPEKALAMFCSSYENGSDQALLSIEEYAYAYYSGNTEGVDTNFNTAFLYYQTLADYGNTRGMYNLGLLYIYGLGVSPDREKGVDWISKAAESGDELAQAMLTVLDVH